MNIPQIIIIIVLFKRKVANLSSSPILFRLCNSPEENIKLIIYDNSPCNDPNIYKVLSERVIYFHNKTNPGLAYPYNFALDYCNKEGIQWLLLLDQDTLLTNEYFEELLPFVKSN